LLLQNWHRAFNEAEAAHGQHFNNNNHVQKEIANEIALVIGQVFVCRDSQSPRMRQDTKCLQTF
jgi:hypothetical protein